MSSQYRVVLEDRALWVIRRYIWGYKTYFIRTYEDSGLWGEDLIIEGYIRKWDQIAERMLALLRERFSSEKILGRTSDTTHIILFEQKVLIVTYSEDRDEHIRYIEDVIIAERR